MSPEAVELAKRQIRLRFLDLDKEFIEAWNAMSSEFTKHNALRSSRYALTAHALCEQELKRRSEAAWNVFRELLDSEGFVPSEDNRGQFCKIVEEALADGCKEVEKIYFKRTNGLLPAEATNLDKGRRHGIESALAAFDGDILRRVKRRPPLEEELSPPRYHPTRQHWRKALELASQATPDLPNAVKEAVSAVESLAQVVVGKSGITLGDAVKQLRGQKRIPPGSDSVIEGLWTFANASPGARHGSAMPAHIDPSHWTFARTTAEATLRLLLDLDTAG